MQIVRDGCRLTWFSLYDVEWSGGVWGIGLFSGSVSVDSLTGMFYIAAVSDWIVFCWLRSMVSRVI